MYGFKGLSWWGRPGMFYSPSRTAAWHDLSLQAACKCSRPRSDPRLRGDKSHTKGCKCPKCMILGPVYRDPVKVVPIDTWDSDYHNCGIYVGRTLNQALHYGNVMVIVSLEGKVVVCSTGYRCLGSAYIEAVVTVDPAGLEDDVMWAGVRNSYKIAKEAGLPVFGLLEAIDMVEQSFKEALAA